MKTIQGKDFDFCDVILYNHNDKEIVMIVNDVENLEKFKYTGNPSDAPVIVMPYNIEFEKQVIKNMKKIQKYEKVADGIEVLYVDNTTVVFDLSNEEVVNNNLQAQKNLIKEEIAANFSSISKEEKEVRKKEISEKLKKSIVSILANLTLIADDFVSKNKKAKKQKNDSNIFINRNYVDNSKKLYQELLDKNSILLKYQQVVNINWNEDLALRIIELMNGSYFNSIKDMNLDTKINEVKKILQSLALIVMGNLNPEIKIDDMVELSNYFENQKDKVLVHNAMIISKNAVNELVGEFPDGQILDESNYSTINKILNEYKGSINQLLNYEFKTFNDREFLETNISSKWLITLIFEEINSLIPEDSSIEIEVAGVTQKIYYRYFLDTEKNNIYIPRVESDGSIEYYENSSNQKYTKNHMFSLAGLLLEENSIDSNPNIKEMGISPIIDDKFNEFIEEMYNID